MAKCKAGLIDYQANVNTINFEKFATYAKPQAQGSDINDFDFNKAIASKEEQKGDFDFNFNNG